MLKKTPERSVEANDITYRAQFVTPHRENKSFLSIKDTVYASNSFMGNDCLHKLFSLAC